MSPPQTNAPPMTISPTQRVVICYAKSGAKVVQELWTRQGLTNEKIEVVGEASQELLDWWDVHDGEIFCAQAIS